MINIENEYLELMAGVLYGGKDKEDRTGTGTKSVFGRMLRHDMALGFPILTTKKYILKKHLQKFFGLFKEEPILSISTIIILIIGITIIKDQSELTERWVKYTAINGVILIMLISLRRLLQKLKRILIREDLWFRLGILLIWMIWFYLLVTTVSKFI